MRVIAALLIMAGSLAGCAHSVTLMSETSGVAGHGTATGMGGGGDLTVNVAGKTYTGHWVMAEGGGIGVVNGFAGSTSFTGTSIMAGAGSGNALLHAKDGSGLRCQFVWSSLSQAGYGKCRDDSGTVYDIQVR